MVLVGECFSREQISAPLNTEDARTILKNISIDIDRIDNSFWYLFLLSRGTAG